MFFDDELVTLRSPTVVCLKPGGRLEEGADKPGKYKNNERLGRITHGEAERKYTLVVLADSTYLKRVSNANHRDLSAQRSYSISLFGAWMFSML